jgi:hypothetical protein
MGAPSRSDHRLRGPRRVARRAWVALAPACRWTGPRRAASLSHSVACAHAAASSFARSCSFATVLRCSPPARTGFVTVVLHGRVDPLVPLAHGEALHVRAARQHRLRQP